MEEYTLYLDESKNKEHTLFTISGFIIKNSNIEKLNSGIYNAKKCIWDEMYIKSNHPVLHCVELTSIKNNRDNRKFLTSYLKQYPHYLYLQKEDSTTIKKIYDNVYSKLCKIFKDIDGIVIGCVVDMNKFKFIYGNDFKVDSELFFEVAMQEIIENYSYFLYKNNGIGNIVYEARNDEDSKTNKSPDFKMYNNFCKIKSTNKGISFINQDIVSKTIRYLNIFNKQEDVAGLQLADFIAYNILQSEKRSKSQYTEFMNKISDNIYNGNFDKTDRNLVDYFGLKCLPYDFENIHSLETENAKLKKSQENLKTERNKLTKKNNLLNNGKNKLLEQNKKLTEEIKRLKAELNKCKINTETIDNSI